MAKCLDSVIFGKSYGIGEALFVTDVSVMIIDRQMQKQCATLTCSAICSVAPLNGSRISLE